MFKINSVDELTADKVKKIYDQFIADDYTRLVMLEKYSKGRNPRILRKSVLGIKDADLSKIPVSYGRKIVTTVSGYMYKPGNITYSFSEGVNQDLITQIYSDNDEDMHNSELGRKVSMFGIGYEMFFLDADQNLKLFIPDVMDIIPLYDYSLEPILLAFIRWYQIGTVIKFEIYTKTNNKNYEMDTEDKNRRVKTLAETPNLLDFVPLNVFINNTDLMGDFENVLELIDAYDNLLSSCNDELVKWAISYLLISGAKLGKEQIEQMKATRTLSNLDAKDSVGWLTKDINTSFLTFMRDALREEIQLLTHVPDFVKLRSGDAQSGASLDRLLFDFEFLCSTKESFFKKALYNRLTLIDQFEDIGDDFKDNIEINFNRNKPSDSTLNADLFNKYWGKLSNFTVIKNFATFVEDPEQEMIDKAEEDAGMMDALTPAPAAEDPNNQNTISPDNAPGLIGPPKKVTVVEHTRTMPGVA